MSARESLDAFVKGQASHLSGATLIIAQTSFLSGLSSAARFMPCEEALKFSGELVQIQIELTQRAFQMGVP